MRQQLREWIFSTRDAGFLTEPQMWQRIGKDSMPLELAANDQRYPLPRLLAAADLVGRAESVPEQVKLLTDADDGVRYWAAVGLNAAGKEAAPAREDLTKALTDEAPVVRIEAASALVKLGDSAAALPVLERELRSDDGGVAMHAARALELLGEAAAPVRPAMREVLDAAGKRKGDGWQFVQFSLKAALEGQR